MNLKATLANLMDNFKNLETAARTLENQNYADIAHSACAKIQQLRDHPDVDAVAEKLDDPAQAELDMTTGQSAELQPSQAPYSAPPAAAPSTGP